MEQEFDWNINSWDILDKYFKETSLTEHQLESYADLIDNIIPQMIAHNSPICIPPTEDQFEIKSDESKIIKIYLNNIYICKPLIQENYGAITPLLPMMARYRNISYTSPLFVDIEIQYGGQSIKEDKYPLMKIPVMVRSKYCHLYGLSDELRANMGECKLDQGGYFIINGGEKVVVAQERAAENKLYLREASKATPSYTHEAEIKSSLDQRFFPIKVNKLYVIQEHLEQRQKKLNDSKTIVVTLPCLKDHIPLFVLFRAIGITSDKEIFELIFGENPENNNIRSDFIDFIRLSAMYVSGSESSTCVSNQIQALSFIKDKLKPNILTNVINKILYDGRDNRKPSNICKYLRSPEYTDINTTNVRNNFEDLPDLKMVYEIINNEFLPHLSLDIYKKAHYLGYMARNLMYFYFGLREKDDRDNYSNKRLDLTGPLIGQIIRTNLIKLIKTIRKSILGIKVTSANVLQQYLTNIKKILSTSNIHNKVIYCLSTGNWIITPGQSDTTKTGVAQVLNRCTYGGTLSHTRRIHSPLMKTNNKIIKPRRLDMTHFGMCCVDESPEGAQIGILKNLAMQCKITIYVPDIQVKLILQSYQNQLFFKYVGEYNPVDIHKGVLVFINGDMMGWVPSDNKAKILYDVLLTFKRHAIINPLISISWYIDLKEIHIQTDGGRYTRPLFIVNSETQQLLIKERGFDWKLDTVTWKSLIDGSFINLHDVERTINNGGVIEYVDTNELDNSTISSYYNILENSIQVINTKVGNFIRFTHCEINPMMTKGVISQMIPFSNHNKSARNSFQCAMGKQAIGIYAYNYNCRFDTIGHVMIYGHDPIVSTRTMKYTLMDKSPSGEQVILAYLSFTGYDQEDAIILNKSACQRGLFNTLYFKTYVDERIKHKTSSNSTEHYNNPKNIPNRTERTDKKYHAIDEFGYPINKSYVNDGDVIIGKVMKLKDKQEGDKYKDMSVTVRHNESGQIDLTICPREDSKFSNMMQITGEGNQFQKVRLCSLRVPEVGDKFASRHAQKGCCGLLLDQCDMPFTKDGEYVDLIMNPHGLPSRMT